MADMAFDASTRNPQFFFLVSCKLPEVFVKALGVHLSAKSRPGMHVC